VLYADINCIRFIFLQADSLNRVVRKITLTSRTVTTIAGRAGVSSFVDGVGTQAMFLRPYASALDPTGTVAFIVRTKWCFIAWQ
jgi:hypothetical protein